MFKIIVAYVILSASGSPVPQESSPSLVFNNERACWRAIEALKPADLSLLGHEAAKLGAHHVVLNCLGGA